MHPKIQKAINEQINAELFSAYLYLSMAAYFDRQGLKGFANWMKVQAQEEIAHAMKFYTFVFLRGENVELYAINKPESDFKSPLDVAEKTLAHEKKVTGLINKLYKLAAEENDHAFKSLLKWYIDEQVEEEENASELIEQIKLAVKKSPNMSVLDKELSMRKFKDSTND
jgi:ferritin